MSALLALLVLAAPVPPAADPGPPREVLRALAAAGAGDPDIARVQAAAARLASPPPVRGSLLAALLPRVTAEVRHAEDSNRVIGLQSAGEVDYQRLSPHTGFVLRATWDLARLLPPPERPTLEGAARRDQAVVRATRLYYERRQLRARLLLAPPADPAERADAEVAVDRLGAELDALTGGLSRGAP